jgi:hypothetical protein
VVLQIALLEPERHFILRVHERPPPPSRFSFQLSSAANYEDRKDRHRATENYHPNNGSTMLVVNSGEPFFRELNGCFLVSNRSLREETRQWLPFFFG